MTIRSNRFPMTLRRSTGVRLAGSVRSSLEDDSDVQKKHYNAGYQDGLLVGKEENKKEFEAEKAALEKKVDAILGLLIPAQEALEEQTKTALFDYIHQLVEGILRGVSSVNKENFQQVLETVFDQLPACLSAYTIRSHPRDKETIEEYIRPLSNASAFTIETDEQLLLGGLVVHGPVLKIDASLEVRLSTCIDGIS
jgi:flagellar biosynthesis/type III secretory pathway protein FliH